jgi:flagellin
MIINHNMNAINTNRVYGNNVKEVGKDMEKLSSGMRINRAGDDAAGLAVSEKLRTQHRGLAQGSRNAADAISFIQTTEGHLSEVSNILQRMRVLSVQSANGTYTEEDRSAIQIEVDQLTDEIARIADQADFNKMKMLTDASAEANVRAADELGMTPAKINVPPSLQNAQASWTLRVQVGANTNEALAVNVFAANVQHLFSGEAGVNEGGAAAGQQQGQGEQGAAGPVNVMSAIEANSSIAKVDVALMAVNSQRSNLGAFQNRLESAVRSNDYAVENLTAAESRIRDTDMAAQMVEFTKDNILTQSAQAMLAQANQLPQGVLRLLG